MIVEYAIVRDRRFPLEVVPAKAGTHTPCPIERTWLHSPSKTGVNALMLGPGSTSAFNRVCDALWAGTTGRQATAGNTRPVPTRRSTAYAAPFKSCPRIGNERRRLPVAAKI